MSATAVALPAGRTVSPTLVAVCALGSAATLTRVVVDPVEGWTGVLTAAVFGTTLALGGLVFIAVQAAAGGRWWRSLAAAPLGLARTLPVPAAALGACVLLGLQTLYPWSRPGASEAVSAKAVWLNEPMFVARTIVVLLVWFVFVGAFGRRLEALHAEPSRAQKRRLARLSVGFLVCLAITLSIAAWDWTMSLEPEWYSTVYGVYVFAGTFLGGIAAVTVLSLSSVGGLPPASASQRHDLGKLLFAMATFWAYLWFCQYMLIWYTDLPEETEHFVHRFTGGWSTAFWLDPLLSWVAPFVLLLAAGPKRSVRTLRLAAVVVLLGRWLDVWLLVAPGAGPAPSFPLSAAAASLAVMAAMALVLRRSLRAV